MSVGGSVSGGRWGRWTGRVLPFAIATLAVGCVAEADGQDPLRAGDSVSETRVVRTGAGTEVTIDFGRLGVPENRSRTDSNTIEIAYARLHSTSEEPGRPLFYLAGGPGDASVYQARDEQWLEVWEPFLELGDVVLVDQRGAGESTPSLRWRMDELPPLDVFSSRDKLLAHGSTMIRRARADLESRGIDLAGYTTVENADDIDALRSALGYEEIAVLGFSYGTHLGIAYAKRHGTNLGAMVLSNVEGPDQTLKLPADFDTQLRRLSLAVANDPRVGERVPDLYGLALRVRERLDREPMTVTIRTPDRSRSIDVQVGSFFLDYILRRDIGDASDLPVFPRLLYSIDQGDPSVLQWFVQRRAGIAMGVNALNGVMNGASGATAGRRQMIADQAQRSPFGDISNLWPEEMEALWGAPDLGDEFRAPLVSDVPTLLLSGEWDWNTPPYQAEQLRWGLSNATHLSVMGAGHEQVLPHPDIEDAIKRFLRGEDVSGVRASWPPLKFVPLEGYDPDVTHPSVPRP